jgi:hypothetical protein
MGKRIVFFLLLFMLIACISYADTLTLKSGQQIDGKIIERTNKSIKIEIASAEFTYYADEIDSVNGEKFSPADTIAISVPQQNENKVASAEVSGLNSANPYMAGDKKSIRVPQFTPQQKKIAAAVTIGVILAVMFFVLIAYIYSSICLQFIARKTGTSPDWLAWIPIANLFLMCKIASLSYWWLLILLLSFIPILGPLCNLGFSGYLGYKIALARDKSGWIGVMTIVPLVNLVAMGYLAFSD